MKRVVLREVRNQTSFIIIFILKKHFYFGLLYYSNAISTIILNQQYIYFYILFPLHTF